MSELQNAIDTLADGDELREMTRHNAADFVQAIAVVVDAARRQANLDIEVAGQALRDGEEGAWELLTQATRDIWILQATLAVNAALGITTEDTK